MLERGPHEIQSLMTEPSTALIEDFRRLDGDIVVLGAGGKLGPTLATLAVRAAKAAGSKATVTAVSRFTDSRVADTLRSEGVHVHRADLSNESDLHRLPRAENVVFLLGTKFGTSGNEYATWSSNSYIPGRVADLYRESRIAALSTGTIYPLVPTFSGGASEVTRPEPIGEYAMSCLGRERMFEHGSITYGTKVSLIRLNYAVEMRYGVLVDICSAVIAGEPIDVTMPSVNIVWQGYANEVTLRSLLHAASPPFVLNVTGPETVSVRAIANYFAEKLGTDAKLASAEATTALLSNASKCHQLFGYPAVGVNALLDATIEWVLNGGCILGKPTKFQRRDGKF